jgi:hypothetical protein
MKRGLVLVEGQTEERFVNEGLAPYVLAKGLLDLRNQCARVEDLAVQPRASRGVRPTG